MPKFPIACIGSLKLWIGSYMNKGFKIFPSFTSEKNGDTHKQQFWRSLRRARAEFEAASLSKHRFADRIWMISRDRLRIIISDVIASESRESCEIHSPDTMADEHLMCHKLCIILIIACMLSRECLLRLFFFKKVSAWSWASSYRGILLPGRYSCLDSYKACGHVRLELAAI